MKTKQHQQGNLMLVTVILIVILAVFGVTAVRTISSESASSVLALGEHQSFYLAESGAEYGMLQIKSTLDVNNPTVYCDGAWKTTQTLGVGQFRFNCVRYAPVGVTITTALSATGLIIPISTLTGVAPIGRVTIGTEQIDYAGTSTSASLCGTQPCLVARKRGANGTTAAIHNSGDAVVQTQLMLTSEGDVPTVASPIKQSVIQKAITATVSEDFSNAWAVGNAGALYRQVGSTGSWVRYATLGTQDLNDIACANANYCLIVGDGGVTYLWNGTSWASAASPTGNNLISDACPVATACWAIDSTNRVYSWNGSSWSAATLLTSTKEIACASTSMCIIVGDNGYITRWNGASWTAMTSGTSEDLTSVSCPSITICYVVGSDQTILKMTGGTWAFQTSPPIGSGGNKDLISISCGDINNCWAFGTKNFYAAQVTDGTNWTAPTVDLTNKTPAIYAMYCPFASLCFMASARRDANNAFIPKYENGTWGDVLISDTNAQHTRAISSDYNAGSPALIITGIDWREVFG